MKPESPQGFSPTQLQRLARQYGRESVASRILKLPSRKLLSDGRPELSYEGNSERFYRQHWRGLKSSEEGEETDGWGGEEEGGQTDQDDQGEEESGGSDESTEDGESTGNDDNSRMKVEKRGAEESSAGGQGEVDKISLPQAVRAQVKSKDESISSLSKHAKVGTDNNSNTKDANMSIAKRNGEDIKRLSMMLMKIIKQYHVKSIVDVPCRAHAHWMPIFLQHVVEQAKDKEALNYICVDSSGTILKELKRRTPKGVTATFLVRRFWEEGLPKGDLVFSWAGLDNMKQKNVLKYVRNLSTSGKRHMLVILGSHSGELAKKGTPERIARFTFGGKPINFRGKPFFLAKPMRIIGEVSSEGNDKQMYIYEPWSILSKK